MRSRSRGLDFERAPTRPFASPRRRSRRDPHRVRRRDLPELQMAVIRDEIRRAERAQRFGMTPAADDVVAGPRSSRRSAAGESEVRAAVEPRAREVGIVVGHDAPAEVDLAAVGGFECLEGGGGHRGWGSQARRTMGRGHLRMPSACVRL